MYLLQKPSNYTQDNCPPSYIMDKNKQLCVPGPNVHTNSPVNFKPVTFQPVSWASAQGVNTTGKLYPPPKI